MRQEKMLGTSLQYEVMLQPAHVVTEHEPLPMEDRIQVQIVAPRILPVLLLPHMARCSCCCCRLVPRGFEHWMSWDTNPLYALLHEAIYCQGAASNWSAHRIRQQHFAAEFDALTAAQQGE